MSEEKIKILILGDELGMGEPLLKALEKEGHEVYHFLRPDDAFNKLGQGKFDFVFADCMLAGSMNGVEFVKNVRANYNQPHVKYVLMSGVFIDKDFIKESIEQTRAIAFLEKKSGFDYSQATKLVVRREESRSEMPPARKLLYQMFSKETVSSREKRKIIESLEDVSGFDLPFVYSLLVETRSSGYLNIYEKSGAVSGISISQGNIVGVDVEDRTTYLGEMLIQSGFSTPENVQAALNERTSQKIGSRLIRANQLSPHAFDLILTEQMNIRLSRTIGDHMIRINFVTTDVEKSTPCIDSDQLQYYLHDWIASKVNVAWLKSLYIMWAGNKLQLSPGYREDHPSLEMGLAKALPGVIDKIRGGATLNQLLEEKKYNEAAIYKGIHFLLTKGLVVFGAKAAFKSDAEQQAALRKIWNDIQGRNAYEIIDLLGAENIVGDNLNVLLGPEPKSKQSATATLWNNLKVKIEEASRKAGDVQSREKFTQDSANREVEGRLKAGQKLDDAKKILGLNQFAKALELLTDVQKTHPQMERLHVLLAWAKLGSIDPARKAMMLKEIEFELVQVPAEERYDAHYPMVLGLFHKAKGDLAGARKHLERAIALDSSLIAARREMSLVEAQLRKEKDLFSNVDLKGMVAGLFKKK